MLGGDDSADKLGVVGTPPAGVRARPSPRPRTQAGIEVDVEPVADVATGEARLEDDSLDGLLVVPADGGDAEFVVKERDTGAFSQVVASAYSGAAVNDALVEAGVDPAVIQAAAQPPTVRELEPSDPNRDTAFIFANVGRHPPVHRDLHVRDVGPDRRRRGEAEPRRRGRPLDQSGRATCWSARSSGSACSGSSSW